MGYLNLEGAKIISFLSYDSDVINVWSEWNTLGEHNVNWTIVIFHTITGSGF